MPFTPPKFWQNGGYISTILKPLGWCYNAIVQHHLNKAGTPASVPVICIGNLNIGGGGKTPTTIALARYLSELGNNVHILSRGYGGIHKISHRVLAEDNAQDVGDEPCLLSQHGTVWVGVDRVQSAQHAIKAGSTILLMDDGFQNPGLKKDISLVVVDGTIGFGNGTVFPSGPLRESIKSGLSRATAVMIIGTPIQKLTENLKSYSGPIFHTQPIFSPPKNIKKCIAFSGISHPKKFFGALRKTGIQIVQTVSFPDHHHFTAKELQKLRYASIKKKAPLVTTEKDWVRLTPESRRNIHILKMSLELPQALYAMIHKRIEV